MELPMYNKNIFKIFILIYCLWFLTPTLSQAIETICTYGKTKYIYIGKPIIKKEPYCLTYPEDQKKASLISLNCKNKTCEALKEPSQIISKQKLYSEIGSPGFHLCRTLKGKPQLLDYWHGNQWHSTSRCQFSDDSFIEIDYLYHLWSKSIF